LNRKLVFTPIPSKAMQIILLLFAILISFGFLMQNTFSVKQTKQQVRHEYRQAASAPALTPEIG
jgi:hypothetical protein